MRSFRPPFGLALLMALGFSGLVGCGSNRTQEEDPGGNYGGGGPGGMGGGSNLGGGGALGGMGGGGGGGAPVCPPTRPASAACAPASLIVDDFEGCGATDAWDAYVDASKPPPTPTDAYAVVATPDNPAQHAMLLNFSLPNLVFARELRDAGQCWNHLGASGLQFRATASAATEIEVAVTLTANTPKEDSDSKGTCSPEEDKADRCYDFHKIKVPLAAGAGTYTIPFLDMHQDGSGKMLDLRLEDAINIEFRSSKSGFQVWLDDISVLPTPARPVLGVPCACGGPQVPFGSHPTPYAAGAVLPTGVLDLSIARAYSDWRNLYLQPKCKGYVVAVDEVPDVPDGLTVSEAMGYGMILTAFMAGVDPKAQEYFNGLLDVTRSIPSRSNKAFMAFALNKNCLPPKADEARSATDGDLDIAYALLLAHRQWGSNCPGGGRDYLGEALRIINALMASIAAPASGNKSWLYLGDWAKSDSLSNVMRTSDFMPDHLRAFGVATNDPQWNTLNDSIYATFGRLQSPSTGLIADFLVGMDKTPQNATGEVLEGPTDSQYSENASRIPWRVGLDYLISGDKRAQGFVQKLATWAQKATGGNPASFMGSYALDGKPPTSSDEKGALNYLGSIGVGAMSDKTLLPWLDTLYKYTREEPIGVYFPDTVRVLTLIAMSGNWWSPATLMCR